MLEQNNALLRLRTDDDLLPIHVAVMSGQNSMASYLLSKTPLNDLNPLDRIDLLILTIESDMHDLGLKILHEDSTLATAEDKFGQTALEFLAKKPTTIGNTSDLPLWKRCLNFCFKGLYEPHLETEGALELIQRLWSYIRNSSEEDFSQLIDQQLSTIHTAAALGNVEFLKIITGDSPDLILESGEDGNNLVHVAILYRQKFVFSLLYERVSLVKLASAVNEKGNNVLHCAGMLAPPERLNVQSGEALQMREELLGFKEIEKIVPRSIRRKRNKGGEMPHELFTSEHESLREGGEKWMTKTGKNCMLVATFIATIVFAAAFTLPGGNNQEKGTPILLESNWFWVFFLSNAISLLSSSTSILIFLSILTSSYKHEEFLKSLPRKMLFGLITLFTSVVGMMLAFSAMCFLVYRSKMVWIPIVVITLASVPVILFVGLQWEFWAVLAYAAYGSKGLSRPHKHWFSPRTIFDAIRYFFTDTFYVILVRWRRFSS